MGCPGTRYTLITSKRTCGGNSIGSCRTYCRASLRTILRLCSSTAASAGVISCAVRVFTSMTQSNSPCHAIKSDRLVDVPATIGVLQPYTPCAADRSKPHPRPAFPWRDVVPPHRSCGAASPRGPALRFRVPPRQATLSIPNSFSNCQRLSRTPQMTEVTHEQN
jgi:hypothetical protein